MNRLAVIAVLLSGTLLAQRWRQPEGCPYADPKLTSTEAEEVAWAAYELPLDDGDRRGQIADLRAALRTWRTDDSPTGRSVHAQLLRALALRDAVLLPDELTVPEDPTLRVLATVLLLRVPDNGPLFFAFCQRQPNEAEWEVLGGALALRRHPAFAARVFSSWQPTLRIDVREARQPRTVEVAPWVEPSVLQLFPPPRIGWRRDERGILAPALGGGKPDGGQLLGVTESESRCARLRWLAYLAAEPDPRTFVGVFESSWTDRELNDYESRVARLRERGGRTAERIEAVFREQRWIPATRRVPKLAVEVVDRRGPAARAARPLPAIDGVSITVPQPTTAATPARADR